MTEDPNRTMGILLVRISQRTSCCENSKCRKKRLFVCMVILKHA